MRCIVGVAPPRTDAAVAAYDASVAAARELGAVTTHASFTGRRYEEFETFEAFKTSFEAHKKSVERAEPILRKHKMKLAIENHKGWRAPEHAAWIKQLGSEYVGVCYDFGNNIALCEDPVDTYRLLAPLTIYASFKDMAVAPSEEGFLLSEMALGEGMLDIPGMVSGLQKRDPNMIFALEMITRVPLRIPVFTKRYWATFDDSYSPLPGRELARLRSSWRERRRSPFTTTAGSEPGRVAEARRRSHQSFHRLREEEPVAVSSGARRTAKACGTSDARPPVNTPTSGFVHPYVFRKAHRGTP